MKERPILMSGAMVNAILSGAKTQTRRVVDVSKIKPSTWTHQGIEAIRPVADLGPDHRDLWQAKTSRWSVWSRGFLCPYGKVGDRLWLKETYLNNALDGYEPVYFYKADDTDKPSDRKWKSGRFMPRVASRITLEITNVRVERLNEISEEDAIAEGVKPSMEESWRRPGEFVTQVTAAENFAFLWNKINGKKHPWASNPFVWVVEFKVA